MPIDCSHLEATGKPMAFGHFDPITAEQNRRFMTWSPGEQQQGMGLVGQG